MLKGVRGCLQKDGKEGPLLRSSVESTWQRLVESPSLLHVDRARREVLHVMEMFACCFSCNLLFVLS